MKRRRLTYDEWQCITAKKQTGEFIQTEFFSGYLGLLDILAVSEMQTWNYHGKEMTICDENYSWLSILPKKDSFCMTAMHDSSIKTSQQLQETLLANMDGLMDFTKRCLNLVNGNFVEKNFQK